VLSKKVLEYKYIPVSKRQPYEKDAFVLHLTFTVFSIIIGDSCTVISHTEGETHIHHSDYENLTSCWRLLQAA